MRRKSRELLIFVIVLLVLVVCGVFSCIFLLVCFLLLWGCCMFSIRIQVPIRGIVGPMWGTLLCGGLKALYTFLLKYFCFLFLGAAEPM